MMFYCCTQTLVQLLGVGLVHKRGVCILMFGAVSSEVLLPAEDLKLSNEFGSR